MMTIKNADSTVMIPRREWFGLPNVTHTPVAENETQFAELFINISHGLRQMIQ
jgi:hypothetical protein